MNTVAKFWAYLKKDTWDAWLVSVILIIICIKYIFFPLLSFTTGTPLPLVVVESCSMYHASSFDDWWNQNSAWYESKGISYESFKQFSLKNGINKGDIVLVWGRGNYEKGDIIIFQSETQYPIIHRIVSESPLSTKGDHNPDQLTLERNISSSAIIGKAVAKIPLLGWIKLIFFEPFKSPENRGLCKP